MIKKSTLEFLKELKINNNRRWFNENRQLYDKARENIYVLTTHLLGEISKFDESVQGINPEECLFRIYRDTRFSKDKSPYKTNFGTFMKKGGRKSPGAGYYVHIEPGGSFIGGGIHMPPADELYMIRSYIADKPDMLKQIINKTVFKKEFGAIRGEQLKTAPKGFSREHPDIELLRYKSYTVLKEFSDREILSDDFQGKCIKSFMILKDFNKFLDSALAH